VTGILKWPNDVLVDDCKLAGILLERSGDRVVAGFGVNLAAAPNIEGRATTSLKGRVSAEGFAPLLAGAFGRLIREWRRLGPDWLVRAWQAAALPVGSRLRVHDGPETLVEGSFAGIEPDGAMRLRLDNGEVRIVRAGDVALANGGTEG